MIGVVCLANLVSYILGGSHVPGVFLAGLSYCVLVSLCGCVCSVLFVYLERVCCLLSWCVFVFVVVVNLRLDFLERVFSLLF